LLGVSAHSDFNSLHDKYPSGGPIDANDQALSDSGSSKQTGANIMFGVAGAAAVTTAILYFYEGSRNEDTFLVAPLFDRQAAGATWRVRF
jgi:hypothetical protein